MFRYPCGIPDSRNEYLYITGRIEQGRGNKDEVGNKVAKFGPNGFIEFLPSLKTGRTNHVCAGYYNSQDNFVLLVAGGRDNIRGGPTTNVKYSILKILFMFFTAFTASTEIFEVGVSSQWREVSPLPQGLVQAKAVTLNNKVYLTGNI